MAKQQKITIRALIRFLTNYEWHEMKKLIE